MKIILRTVLVIDDHVWTRRLMKELLVEAGYEVIEATDCSDALELLERLRIDAVITDIIMPGKIEGNELIATVRERWPELPVVAISAGGAGDREGYLQTALSLGASAAVAKPFEPHELLAPIERLAVR